MKKEARKQVKYNKKKMKNEINKITIYITNICILYIISIYFKYINTKLCIIIYIYIYYTYILYIHI